MAYTEVPLPKGVWVEFQAGPATGVIIPSSAGDIRIRTETSTPPVNEGGLPTFKEGNNFEIEAGVSLYAMSVNIDSLAYKNLKDV